METIKVLWGKYRWIIIVLLAIYAAYKTFVPAEVKTVTVEKTVTVTDKTTEIKLKAEVSSLKRKLSQYTRDIQKDEVVIETKYPDGRVERRIEKKTNTQAHGSSEVIINDSSAIVYDGKTNETKVEDKKKTETQVTNPTPLWSTLIGIQVVNKQLIVGQGMSIGKGWTGMVLGSYTAKDGLKEGDRWDVGGAMVLRY